MSRANVGVLFYLSDCRGIVYSLTTVGALIEFHGRSRISLALARSGYSFANFLKVLVAAIGANS